VQRELINLIIKRLCDEKYYHNYYESYAFSFVIALALCMISALLLTYSLYNQGICLFFA